MTIAADYVDPKAANSAGVASMTGFARLEGGVEPYRWIWEARSVNGRSLDLRFRVPPGYDRLDPVIRAEVNRRFKRGNVSVQLTLSRTQAAPQLRVNRPLLEEMMRLMRDFAAVGAAPPRVDGLLALRGMLETVEDDTADVADADLTADLASVLDALVEARAAEGARLQPALTDHLDRIDALVGEAANSAAAQPAALRERLRANVQALLEASPALPEDRLAQEAAILATKADVREELDRLVAHVAQARALLGGGGVVGRRLDFLCQEFNREANTLCSKAADMALTQTGLELKAVIDQFREQVQNIE